MVGSWKRPEPRVRFWMSFFVILFALALLHRAWSSVTRFSYVVPRSSIRFRIWLPRPAHSLALSLGSIVPSFHGG